MRVIFIALGYLPELDNRPMAEGTTHINSCTQLWVDQARCSSWCNNGMTITGVTNCSLIDFKVPSKGGNAWLVE